MEVEANSTPVRTVDPTSEPVSLRQLKAQLRLAANYTAHDSQLQLLLQAAREQFEHDTNRVCMTSTWALTGDCWWEHDDGWQIPLQPVTAISSLVYKDVNGTDQTWSSSNYVLDVRRAIPVVWYAYNVSVPTLYSVPSALTLTFTAGYSDADDVPARWKQAILMLAAYWFENATPVVLGTTATELPLSYSRIIAGLERSSYP